MVRMVLSLTGASMLALVNPCCAIGVDEIEVGATVGGFLTVAAVADDLIHPGAAGVDGAQIGHGSASCHGGGRKRKAGSEADKCSKSYTWGSHPLDRVHLGTIPPPCTGSPKAAAGNAP